MESFFNSAIKALPDVATSPLAFVAYIFLVAAWFGIAMKVNRNKNLLLRLDKLPERDRLRALESEMGVRMRGSLTPEQWLRSRIHLYYFLGFSFICVIALILLVVASQVRDKGSVDLSLGLAERPKPLDMNLTVVKNQAPESETSSPDWYSPEFTLEYHYIQTKTALFIRPELPYLESIRKGKTITGSSTDDPFGWNYPLLAVKVVNNTNKSLYLTDFVVDVKSSEVNREPILTMDSANGWDIYFYNAGWGPAKDVRVSYGITGIPIGKRKDGSLIYDSERLNYSEDDLLALPVGRTNYTSRLPDIGPGMRSESLKIKAHIPKQFMLNNNPVCCFGVTYYKDHIGHQRRLPFRVMANLELGGGLDLGKRGYDLSLKAGRFGYKESITISRILKPGDGDNFPIIIHSDKSARYELDFSFHRAGGEEVAKQKVFIDIFVPNIDRIDKPNNNYPQHTVFKFRKRQVHN